MFRKKPNQPTEPELTEVATTVETQRSNDDVIAELGKRFELKPKPEARICDACGINIEALYGRFFTDDNGRRVWICSRRTCYHFEPSTLQEALRLGACYLLGMSPGKMGPDDLHELLPPWYLSGRTQPNRKSYGHVNHYALVAAVDRRYGKQLTGPRRGYAKERQDTEIVWLIFNDGLTAKREVPKYSNEHPVIIDADIPATYAPASWRPLQVWEKEEQELDSIIAEAKLKRQRAETRISNKKAQINRLQEQVSELS